MPEPYLKRLIEFVGDGPGPAGDIAHPPVIPVFSQGWETLLQESVNLILAKAPKLSACHLHLSD